MAGDAHACRAGRRGTASTRDESARGRSSGRCGGVRRPVDGSLGYLYHVSFYIVGILIVKEGLIVAFIVDAFLSQFEDNRALCEDENIASLDQSRAGEGFRIIASKRSSKDDIYRAMFLEDDD